MMSRFWLTIQRMMDTPRLVSKALLASLGVILLLGGCVEWGAPLSEADCLPGEVLDTEILDTEIEICYAPCEGEACDDGLLTILFDLFGDLVREFSSPSFEDFDAAGRDALVTYPFYTYPELVRLREKILSRMDRTLLESD